MIKQQRQKCSSNSKDSLKSFNLKRSKSKVQPKCLKLQYKKNDMIKSSKLKLKPQIQRKHLLKERQTKNQNLIVNRQCKLDSFNQKYLNIRDLEKISTSKSKQTKCYRSFSLQSKVNDIFFKKHKIKDQSINTKIINKNKNMNLNSRIGTIQQCNDANVVKKQQKYFQFICKRKTYSLPKLNININQKSIIKSLNINQKYSDSTLQPILSLKESQSKLLRQNKLRQQNIKKTSLLLKQSQKIAIHSLKSVKQSQSDSLQKCENSVIAILQIYFKTFIDNLNFRKYFTSKYSIVQEIMKLQKYIYYNFKNNSFIFDSARIHYQNDQLVFKYMNLKHNSRLIIINKIIISDLIQDSNNLDSILFDNQDKQLYLKYIYNLGGVNNFFVNKPIFLQKQEYFRLKSKEDGYQIQYYHNHHKRHQISGLKRKPDTIDNIYVYLSNYSSKKLNVKDKIKVLDFVYFHFFVPLNNYHHQSVGTDQIYKYQQGDQNQKQVIKDLNKDNRMHINKILTFQYSNSASFCRSLRKQIKQKIQFDQNKEVVSTSLISVNLVQIVRKNIFHNGSYHNFQIKIISLKKQRSFSKLFLIVYLSQLQHVQGKYLILPLNLNDNSFYQSLSDKISRNIDERQSIYQTPTRQHCISKNYLHDMVTKCNTITSLKQEIIKRKIFSKQDWNELIFNQSLFSFPYVKIVKKILDNSRRQLSQKQQFVILKIYYVIENNLMIVLVQSKENNYYFFQQLDIFLGHFKSRKLPHSKYKPNQKLRTQKQIKLKPKLNNKTNFLKQERHQTKLKNNQYGKNDRFQQNVQNKITQTINYAFTYKCNIYRNNKTNINIQRQNNKKLKFCKYSQKDQIIQIQDQRQQNSCNFIIQLKQFQFKLNSYKYCWMDYIQNCKMLCFRMQDDTIFTLKFSKNLYMNRFSNQTRSQQVKNNLQQKSENNLFKNDGRVKTKITNLQKNYQNKQKYYQAFLNKLEDYNNNYYHFISELNLMMEIKLNAKKKYVYQIKILNIKEELDFNEQNSGKNWHQQQYDNSSEIRSERNNKISICSSDLISFNVNRLQINKVLLNNNKFRKRFTRTIQMKLADSCSNVYQ